MFKILIDGIKLGLTFIVAVTTVEAVNVAGRKIKEVWNDKESIPIQPKEKSEETE